MIPRVTAAGRTALAVLAVAEREGRIAWYGSTFVDQRSTGSLEKQGLVELYEPERKSRLYDYAWRLTDEGRAVLNTEGT